MTTAITFTVFGKNYSELRGSARRILGEFFLLEEHVVPDFDMDVSPGQETFQSESPVSWTGRVVAVIP